MSVDTRVWGSIFPELRERDDPPARPILGFRVNRVQFDRRLWGKPGLAVRSVVFRQYEWQPGRNEAKCLLPGGLLGEPRHLAPGTGCRCGLYACHDFRQLPASGPRDESLVLTGVAGTGIIRLHAYGWRAQFARIVAFSLATPRLPRLTTREVEILRRVAGQVSGVPFSPPMRDSQRLSRAVARALEEKYQVPVVPIDKLRETMARVGDFWEEKQ